MGLNIKISAPKIKLPKVKLPSVKAKDIGNVMKAVNPVNLSDKVVRQAFGHKGVNLLDKVTGGTYSQAVRVSNLAGRIVGGEAIKQSDWNDAISFGVKVAAVMAAGGAIGYASELAKQEAAKELSKKIGGSAGAIVEAGASVASGSGVQQAATKAASSEAKRVATKEVAKKAGKGAGLVVAVGVASYTSGSSGAVSALKKESVTLVKSEAAQEFEKKTGVPFSLANDLKNGKTPSPAKIKESLKQELTKAPEILRAELKAIPERMKAAPQNVKAVLAEKQRLVTEELKNRDSLVLKAVNEQKNLMPKIKSELEKNVKDTETLVASINKDQAELDKLSKISPQTSALKNKIAALTKKIASDKIKVANMDARSSSLVIQKERAKEEYAAKLMAGSMGNQLTISRGKQKGIDFPLLERA